MQLNTITIPKLKSCERNNAIKRWYGFTGPHLLRQQKDNVVQDLIRYETLASSESLNLVSTC